MHEAFASLFDVAVEDGAVAVEAEFVGDAMDIEPDIGADLALVGLVVDAIVEDFRAAAGQRAEAGVFEFAEHPADAFDAVLGFVLLRDPGEVHHLYSGERLEVQIGRDFLDGPEHVGVVVPGQVRVQAADDVHLGRAVLDRFAGLAADVVEVAGVCAVLILLAIELAELARERADIRVVQVAVDVVVGDAGGEAAADGVGQFQHRPDVRGAEQQVAVVEGQPLPRFDLGADGIEARVGVGGL